MPKSKGKREAKSSRKVALSQAARLAELIENEGEGWSRTQVNIKLSLLENYLQKFDEAQTVLEHINGQPEYDQRYQFEEIYANLKEKLTNLLPSQASSTPTMNFGHSTSITNQRHKTVLPTIQLPKFDGSYSNWSDFSNTFKTLVHDDEVLSPIEKFQLLRTSLTGSAAVVIQALDCTEQNYLKALELLNQRYENKRLIFNSHMSKLWNFSPVRNANSVQQIRDFVDLMNGEIRALQSLATKDQIADGVLISLMCTKLDSTNRSKWEETAPLNRLPSWKDFTEFLERRCQTLEHVHGVSLPPEQSMTPRRRDASRKLVAATVANPKENPRCSLCDSKGHFIHRCHRYAELHVNAKSDLIKKLKLCFNCLKPGHLVRQCKASSCWICRKRHHTSLHQAHGAFESPQPLREIQATAGTSSSTATKVQTSLSCATSPSPNLLSANINDAAIIATAVVNVVAPNGTRIACRALLDSASQAHFVTKRLAQRLGLRKSNSDLTIIGVGGQETLVNECAHVIIESRQGAFQISLVASILPNITSEQPSMFLDTSDWNIPKNVALADPTFNKPGRIDMLIGAEFFMCLLCIGQIKIGPNLPVLQKSVFGWLVSGPLKGNASRVTSRTSLSHVTTFLELDEEAITTNRIHDTMKQFWEMETITSGKKFRTDEEECCEKIFASTYSRDDQGRFIVRLPFKDDPRSLGSSWSSAKVRFESLRKKFERNSSFRDSYYNFMIEYERLQHMKELGLDTPENHIYHLPHHGIMQGAGASMKLRVVFDASCRASSGKSLNDLLMVGPVVQDDLFAILCRFRKHPYVFTADIVKMYRQVLVHPDDTSFQTVLWQRPEDTEIQQFQLITVTYGTSAAPFLATRCLKELSILHRDEFPEGSAILENDVYVDDVLSGASSLEELSMLRNQLIALLDKAQIRLHKWCANSPEILESIPISEQQASVHLGDESLTRALGMLWNPATDKFCFRSSDGHDSQKVTKRKILSSISTLFDPLGLVNPVTVRAKIIMQELWKLKLHWDESLPSALDTQWRNFVSQLNRINDIHVDRCLIRSSCTTMQLHGFADASEKAFGACLYLRVSDVTNGFKSNLICAKSRVAPIKPVTIPRLELCAAVLLCELVEKTVSALKIDGIQVFCWSDSTIVLSWIQRAASTWKTFVSHRVAAIHDKTENLGIEWRHVTSDENPADILSRGALPAQLLNNQQWFHGPEFLTKSHSEWPATCLTGDTQIELRKVKLALPTCQQVDLIKTLKFANNYQSVVRIFAYIARFTNGCLRRNTRVNTLELGVEDISAGEVLVAKAMQRAHFKSEIDSIENGRPLANSSRIRCLNPFLDEYGVLRVGGRLQNSNLSQDMKHPILIPDKHPFARVIIRHWHFKNFHAGCLTLQSLLRHRFWILNSRRVIRLVIHQCKICFMSKPVTMNQIMGNLPQDRLRVTFPFLHSGVDFAGPFSLKPIVRSKVTMKAYVALFICFSTKTVHIELVSNLSSAAFIAALKRFVARRGRCQQITSDNATNFVGAKRELSDLAKMFNDQSQLQEIKKFCNDEAITWKFIPPRSPHFGGLWEASIKKAKHHLTRILQNEPLNYEEFTTILSQIEAILNSRPLTPISSDPSDPAALTPAHFLIGRPLITIPEPDLTHLEMNRLSRWQHLTRLHQHFWNRWSKEYIGTLQQRNKWQTPQQDLAVGALVLLKEENLPPNFWMLGRVTEVIKGTDGRVRVAEVKTSKGSFKRAITKLCKLPDDDVDDAPVFEDTSRRAAC